MEVAAASSSRKRPEEAAEGERPSKRRRLGQASILCMRELFRTVVNDGDISEDKRILLQNAGVLLSQVDGKTWVSFPDNQGELKELTPQQLSKLRPFFNDVAEELKKQEVQLLCDDSAGSDHFDCLELTKVPWADGITARELIACCSPDEELQFSTRRRWLEMIIRVLPSKYMIKSRVRELLNYYYIQGITPEAAASPDAASTTAPRRIVRCLQALPGASCVASAAAATSAALRRAWQFSCAAAGIISAFVAAAVVGFAAVLASGASQLMNLLPFRQNPVWPLVRLCVAVLLQGQVKNFLGMIVLIARLRVVLCLARCNEVFGYLFYPFVFLAQKVLGWNEGSWLLGCSCDSSKGLSLLSWCPVRATEGLFAALTAIRFLPALTGLTFLASVVNPVVDALHYVEPFVMFVGDLAFSAGFAEGLALIVRSVDRRAHHKLVWMSLNVGRMLREGPPAIAGADSALEAAPAAPQSVADSPQPLPTWSEDGAWNLFDGAE